MSKISEEEIRRHLELLSQVQPSAQSADRAVQRVRRMLTEYKQPTETKNTSVWRIIMKSPITKLAAAAVIIVSAVIILNVIPYSGSVALGQVLERVEQIKTVVYRMKGHMKGLPQMPKDQQLDIDTQARLAYDSGFRMDSVAQVKDEKIETNTYILFDQGTMVTVVPKEKKYIKMKLTDQLLAQMEKDNGDPRTILKRLTEHEYKQLGRTTIDGIEVKGIEVTDFGTDPWMKNIMFDDMVIQLWVDAETELPVQMTINGTANNGQTSINLVIEDFQWGVEIDAADLQPNIPADYELLAETQLGPDPEGRKIIEALAFFSEIANGRYPSSIVGMTTIQEFSDALTAKFGGEPNDSLKKDNLGNLLTLQTMGMFFATLKDQGKDPAYYGDKVTAEFPRAVLMRWKLDDGRFRVVFGDLTVRDVSPEDLTKLESAPLNPLTKAIKPYPADGAKSTALTGLKLSWMPGADANEHNVYFGTSIDNLMLLGKVTTGYAGLAALKRGATYYWRIDEVQSNGSVVTGDIWSFNTGGLVAHWKFDESSGGIAADSSGNRHNGAFAGNPTWVKGIIGGALLFDGDGDYVNAGTHPDFDITEQISITAWIKVNKFDRDWQDIISKGNRSWRLQRNWGQSTIEFACSGLLVPGTRWGGIYGKTEVNDGKWHHLAGVYDGQKLYLYVDGRLDIWQEAPGKIRVNEYPACIGENSEEQKRFWNGLIDDVRIYSYALSPEEIANLYNEVIATLPKPDEATKN